MNYTLITGASKGIGKAFAYECANRGMNLLLVARSATLLEELAADLAKRNIKVAFHTADLLDHAGHKKIFSWIKENGYNVDMLINNAGMGYYGAFATEPLEKHLEVMHLNMDAMVRMAHEFLNNSSPDQKRYILNNVSIGAFQPVPYMAIYAASKSFMLSFTRALRYEWKDKNVNVTALCPGGVETDFFAPAKMEKIAVKTASLMTGADVVAIAGLNALMKNKPVEIPGLINKLGAIAARYSPQGLVISQAANIYRPDNL